MIILSQVNQRTKKQVCGTGGRIRQASLTLECAAVLPLYLIACVVLIMLMNAVKIQGTKNLELSNKVRVLAEAAPLAGSGSDSGSRWIDIRKIERFRFPVSFPGIPKLRILLRARVYPWTGCDGNLFAGSGNDNGSSEHTVLVTENRSVYHTDPDCTHLDLAVFKSTTSEIRNLRNAYGRKYKKCRGFPKNYSGPVYAAAKGDFYYPSENAGSLIRHVSIVSEKECAGLTECERCAAKSGRLIRESHHAA